MARYHIQFFKDNYGKSFLLFMPTDFDEMWNIGHLHFIPASCKFQLPQ